MVESGEGKNPEAKPEPEPARYERNFAFIGILVAIPMAIGGAFFSTGVSLLFGLLPVFANFASGMENMNGEFYLNYVNLLNYMIYGGLVLMVFSGYLGYVAIYSKRKKPKSNKPQESEISNPKQIRDKKYLSHLICGIIVLIIGFVIFYYPIMDDRPEINRWAGFDLIRQQNVTLSKLDFDFVTLENAQSLHIYYSTDHIIGKSPFIMFIIPYLGTLDQNYPDFINDSKTGKWETERLGNLQTTIIYKFIDCNGRENYCVNSMNLYFDFDKKIDSKQYYTHSINIPFNSPHQSELRTEIHRILQDVPYDYWSENDWGMNETISTPTLTVSVPDHSTEYNPLPDAYIKSHRYPRPNDLDVTNSVMTWDVPNRPIDFHLDYVEPTQQYVYNIFSMIGIVLFGVGSSFLVVSFSEYLSGRKK